MAAGTDDRERFERLFHEHHRAVRAYALRRTDPTTAQDVVSETFLVAWRRLADLPDDPLPWLYATARRVLSNTRRASVRAAHLAERVAADRVAALPDPGERLGDRDAMRSALAALAPGDREVLMLVAWEDLEPRAAARVCGCSRATFNVRLHRARGRLRSVIAAAANPPTTDTLTEAPS